MNSLIQQKLNHIPNNPGVYQFFNANKDIIYIGKAKNLKNRVKSYFQNKKHRQAKTISLLRKVVDVDWIIVRNEVEALITEANLIKKYKPRYNIDLKDDKTYPFIRITNEPFPQVLLTRKVIQDGSKYYGPFTDVKQLRITLKALYKAFPIRSCSYYFDDEVIAEKKVKVCLDYHIKKCEGPCEGLVSQKHYKNMINRIENFMKGKTKIAENYIMDLMEKASRSEKYEEAAIFRDQLKAIQLFNKNQSHIATDFTERDVIALARKGKLGIAVIIRIRNGKIFSREKISLSGLDNKDDFTIGTVISRFYMNSDFIPREISLRFKPFNESALISFLREKRDGPIKFLYPKKGEKLKEIKITLENARLLLNEWIIRRKKHYEQVPKMLNQLQDDLNLDVPPRRIEAFDVSHLGGTGTVASLVCFIDAKPIKQEYRKYNLKSVHQIDDYASIREVVFRRYKRLKRENKLFPDLILVDGGKGQLSMALSALRELGLDYIPVIGLAKRLEEVFVPGNPDAQSIHKHSSSLLLLRRIRDEAHRFALSFQRQKRKKIMQNSIFDEIPGMGKKRIKTLYKCYENINIIAKLSPKEVNVKTGIPIKIARQIINITKKLN